MPWCSACATPAFGSSACAGRTSERCGCMKTKAKADRKIRVPTDADDAAINAGIAADDENPEWTQEDFAKAKSAVEVLGTEVAGKLAAMKRPRGRPAGSIKENAKVPVT